MNQVFGKVKCIYELILIALAFFVCYSKLDTHHALFVLSVMWILEDYIERAITRAICKVFGLKRRRRHGRIQEIS